MWLAVPNAMAESGESLGLAGPPDVGDVPVEAPGPGCSQQRALAGAQATPQLHDYESIPIYLTCSRMMHTTAVSM